jgi:hypothetical protein
MPAGEEDRKVPKRLSPYELVSEVAAADFCRPREPIFGCEPRHINRLQNYFGVTLPKVYRDFLCVFGRDTGDILGHMTVAYPWIVKFHHRAVSMFEDENIPLPNNRFVFGFEDSHLWFFDIASGVEDPPVSLLTEGEGIRQVAETFTEWLNVVIGAAIAGGIQMKSYDKRGRAERRKEPSHTEEWKAIASSPFRAGDIVRVREEVVDTRTDLDRRSRITLKKGTQAEVAAVYFRPDRVGCVCVLEVCDESGDNLIACPMVDNWYLELVSSEGRLRPELKWQDLIH